MTNKKRIVGYVDNELYDKVRYYSKKNKKSESQVINETLSSFFETETPWEIILQRLDNHKEIIESLRFQNTLMQESFYLFLKYYFFNNTILKTTEEKEEAEKMGIKQYKMFMKKILDIDDKIKNKNYSSIEEFNDIS